MNMIMIVILTNSSNGFKVKLAENLKSQLEAIGISVTLSSTTNVSKLYPPGHFISPVFSLL